MTGERVCVVRSILLQSQPIIKITVVTAVPTYDLEISVIC